MLKCHPIILNCKISRNRHLSKAQVCVQVNPCIVSPRLCMVTRSDLQLHGMNEMLVHRTWPFPSIICRISLTVCRTHLYSWVERGTVRVKCLAQEHNTMTRPGLEPGPFDPESSALTIWAPRLPQLGNHPPDFVSRGLFYILLLFVIVICFTWKRLCSGQVKGFFCDSLCTGTNSLRSKWPLVFSSTLASDAEAGAVGGRVGWSVTARFPFLMSSGDSSDGNTWNLGMWDV